MNTTVYRIQDKQGRGPFKPGFSSKWVEPRDDHENLIPWIYEFGMVQNKAIVGCAVGCACQTVEQLRRWFTQSEYNTLKRFGYHAVSLEAGRILAESDIQCVIERAIPLREQVTPFDLYP